MLLRFLQDNNLALQTPPQEAVVGKMWIGGDGANSKYSLSRTAKTSSAKV